MSLTGNLEIFPMPEVLRLLSRSKKSGCLRIDAGNVEGRVYLSGGSITFANTQSDDVVRAALLSAGIVTEDSLRSISGTGGTLVDALSEDSDSGTLTDFVREHVVESLYRIRKPGHGDFDFSVDLTPTYPTGQSFDSDVAVAESDRRAAEWDDILSIVGDLDAPIRMVRQLADDNSVTIASATWKVLAALEGGLSVRELATDTGVSEFRSARELSGLMRSELVEVSERSVRTFESNYQAPVVARATDDVEAEITEESAWEAPSWEAPEDATSDPESWFDDAVATDDTEQDAVASDDSEQTDEVEQVLEDIFETAEVTGTEDVADADTPVAEESSDESSDGGWWATAMESNDDDSDDVHGIDSDPDSFLESVFSQLNEDDEEATDETDETDDETGFSMGLLRRRRMGAAARDITQG